MSISVVSSVEELKTHCSAWENLVANAIEPNAFYEPWMLIPALQYLGANNVHVALVWDDAAPGSAPKLNGLFPFVYQSGFHHLPFRCLTLWKHLQCFLCTPLVRRDAEQRFFSEVFEWKVPTSKRHSLLKFEFISGDGPFFEALSAYLLANNHSIELSNQFARPMLKSNLDPASYLHNVVSSRHLKDMRKKRRNLESIGVVKTELLTEISKLEFWIKDFLRLEASGWKGEEGTALIQSEANRDFFIDSCRNAWAQNALIFQRISLAGEAIAMRCSFRSGEGAFSFKLAFDQSHAKFSPGVLLELDTIDYTLSHPELKWFDSCAIPGGMLDRLWSEKRLISSLTMSTGQIMGKYAIPALLNLRIAHRYLASHFVHGRAVL